MASTASFYIVQARPGNRMFSKRPKRYRARELNNKGADSVLVEGRAIGQRIGSGPVRLVDSPDQMSLVQEGDVLVTDTTDPDWEPVMKKASAIVTNRGGHLSRSNHCSRARYPAIVGCGTATSSLNDGDTVTVSCSEGETGYVLQRRTRLPEIKRSEVDELPMLPTKVMMNVGNPDRAFDFAQIPNEGVGLCSS
ncbi:PEP-utilizing enzyme [Vibrio lentus]|nr:PEP-utilizing enzyme [Vibrio lentus]